MLSFPLWYLATRTLTPSVHAHAGHTHQTMQTMTSDGASGPSLLRTGRIDCWVAPLQGQPSNRDRLLPFRRGQIDRGQVPGLTPGADVGAALAFDAGQQGRVERVALGLIATLATAGGFLGRWVSAPFHSAPETTGRAASVASLLSLGRVILKTSPREKLPGLASLLVPPFTCTR